MQKDVGVPCCLYPLEQNSLTRQPPAQSRQSIFLKLPPWIDVGVVQAAKK